MAKQRLSQSILLVLLLNVFGPITYVAQSSDTSTATTAKPTPTPTTSTPTPTATTSTSRSETTTATTSTPTTSTPTPTATTSTSRSETTTATTLTPITCLTRGAIVSRPDWDSANWTEICKPPQTFDFILIIKGGKKFRVIGEPSGVSISDYYYPSEIKKIITTQSDTRTVTTQSDTRTVTTQSLETKYSQLVISSIPELKTRTAETALLINTYKQSDKEKSLTVITKSNKSVVMTVATEIPGVTVLLTATKKNSKSITFTRTTNDQGLASVTTRWSSLSGYLITFSINGVKIDSDPILSIRGKI